MPAERPSGIGVANQSGVPNRMRKHTRVRIIRRLIFFALYLHRHYAPQTRLLDPQFHRSRKNYLIQVALATGALFAILLLVDSLSDAALAVGLGSSAIIIFLSPSYRSASPRALVGGHFLGVLIGLGCTLLLFSSPLEEFFTDSTLRAAIMAASLGLLMLIMSTSDTEHPPAAGTVLGIATKPWDPLTLAIIIGAVLLLALIKFLLHRYLHDLI